MPNRAIFGEIKQKRSRNHALPYLDNGDMVILVELQFLILAKELLGGLWLGNIQSYLLSYQSVNENAVKAHDSDSP